MKQLCKTEEALLQLVAGAMGNNVCAPNDLDETELAAMISTASQQKLLPAVVDALHGCPAAEAWADYAALKRAARMQVMQQAQRGMEFLEVYRKLEAALCGSADENSAGGEPSALLVHRADRPLVVKGCVCRTVWPKGDLRISEDEDVYVRPEDFKKACKVLRECELVCGEKADPETDFEIGWHRPVSTLYIELHQRLFSPESGATEELQRFFDDAFDLAQAYTVEH